MNKSSILHQIRINDNQLSILMTKYDINNIRDFFNDLLDILKDLVKCFDRSIDLDERLDSFKLRTRNRKQRSDQYIFRVNYYSKVENINQQQLKDFKRETYTIYKKR